MIQLHNKQLQFLRMSRRHKNAACGNQLIWKHTRGINQEVVNHKTCITEIITEKYESAVETCCSSACCKKVSSGLRQTKTPKWVMTFRSISSNQLPQQVMFTGFVSWSISAASSLHSSPWFQSFASSETFAQHTRKLEGQWWLEGYACLHWSAGLWLNPARATVHIVLSICLLFHWELKEGWKHPHYVVLWLSSVLLHYLDFNWPVRGELKLWLQ